MCTRNKITRLILIVLCMAVIKQPYDAFALRPLAWDERKEAWLTQKALTQFSESDLDSAIWYAEQDNVLLRKIFDLAQAGLFASTEATPDVMLLRRNAALTLSLLAENKERLTQAGIETAFTSVHAERDDTPAMLRFWLVSDWEHSWMHKITPESARLFYRCADLVAAAYHTLDNRSINDAVVQLQRINVILRVSLTNVYEQQEKTFYDEVNRFINTADPAMFTGHNVVTGLRAIADRTESIVSYFSDTRAIDGLAGFNGVRGQWSCITTSSPELLKSQWRSLVPAKLLREDQGEETFAMKEEVGDDPGHPHTVATVRLVGTFDPLSLSAFCDWYRSLVGQAITAIGGDHESVVHRDTVFDVQEIFAPEVAPALLSYYLSDPWGYVAQSPEQYIPYLQFSSQHQSSNPAVNGVSISGWQPSIKISLWAPGSTLQRTHDDKMIQADQSIADIQMLSLLMRAGAASRMANNRKARPEEIFLNKELAPIFKEFENRWKQWLIEVAQNESAEQLLKALEAAKKQISGMTGEQAAFQENLIATLRQLAHGELREHFVVNLLNAELDEQATDSNRLLREHMGLVCAIVRAGKYEENKDALRAICQETIKKIELAIFGHTDVANYWRATTGSEDLSHERTQAINSLAGMFFGERPLNPERTEYLLTLLRRLDPGRAEKVQNVLNKPPSVAQPLKIDRRALHEAAVGI